MSRDKLVTMVRRTLAHAEAGTVPLADAVAQVPSANYTDPQRWQLEIDRIFKRVPLTFGFGCELPKPGDYRALDVAGVPILLVRGPDLVMRAFVNMCSHRGSILVEEGAGSARRFTCPYHAWSYDQEGTLVGILDRDDFGPFDTSCHGLTELPCEERAGLVFGGLTPGADLHLDAFLCGFDEMLSHLGLADCHLVGRQSVAGPNWKIAYDGYLDIYHLPVLHKATFGPDYCNKAVYDAWGPHQRSMSPDDRVLALADLPESEWPLDRLTGGVWTIFPHISIAGFDVGGKLYMVSQLFPGDEPGTSHTVQNFLATFEPDEEQQARIDEQIEFLLRVVRDEDYYNGARIQRALRTGAKPHVLFGRNEAGGQRFHRWVDDLIATPDDQLGARLAAAEEHHQP